MCGIVGYLGHREALQVVLAGLEKLEYRGYDSAGVAIMARPPSATNSIGTNSEGTDNVFVARALGKLSELRKVLSLRPDCPLNEQVGSAKVRADHLGALQLGIGHTRWATHGRPSETNAHPHCVERVSLIHNGIIENYLELRRELEALGSVFKSETDTEIAAHLLNKHLKSGKIPFEALKATCAEIRGSYAFVAIDSQNPDRLLVAKNSTPIVIGLGSGEVILASDIPAILDHTRQVVILEDGDIAEILVEGLRIENGGVSVFREVQTITWDPVTAQKDGFKHFMLKEIHEQARVLSDTIRGRLVLEESEVHLPELELSDQAISNIKRIVLLGCGTAWHACLVAKFYIESLARISCEVDYSSEFRYRKPILDETTLVLAVSQSGETADTLAAIDMIEKGSFGIERKPTSMAICNVLGSSLTRKAGSVLYTQAGPEISVASTKAFTTQLVSSLLFAVYLGIRRGQIQANEARFILEALVKLPGAIGEALHCEPQVEKVARRFYAARDFLYLGRGPCYPIALEGALKLKEISYIHAEGYPAGEMKHGPIALIDENMPVVVVLQKSKVLIEKTISNLKEVEARGGNIIVATDALSEMRLDQFGLQAHMENLVQVPFLHELLSPILLTIPLQLLAYHVAVLNGTDVDLPRNLAKSVTVE